MLESKFTEAKTIKVLNEHAVRISTSDLCRKHGISSAIFYNSRLT
jgi:hypothetical protein